MTPPEINSSRISCPRQDAIVIGGGFYGAMIAAYLVKRRGLKRVMLLEREPRLFTRASYNNQARVHNGYHYPRSFTTAFRSRINFPKFISDWSDAIDRGFTQIYAIARRNSRVTARQFVKFCKEIGVPVRPAEAGLKRLFEPTLVEGVFVVEEYAFNASALARCAERELNTCGVEIRLNARAAEIYNQPEGYLKILARSGSNASEWIDTRYIFNCTYSNLNRFGGDFRPTRTALKQEITELAMVRPPDAIRDLGITLMDGPFFSMMPFPARNLHTLSHVRYTPHRSWSDQQGGEPYTILDQYERHTRYDRMLRDAQRYVPAMKDVHYVESLFEVKTVLEKNEGDDGRPILFEKHKELPGCYSILGGKIDNIYDILEKLDAETFSRPEQAHASAPEATHG